MTRLNSPFSCSQSCSQSSILYIRTHSQTNATTKLSVSSFLAFLRNRYQNASLQCMASAAGGRSDSRRARLLHSRHRRRQVLLPTRRSRIRLPHSQIHIRPRPVSFYSHFQSPSLPFP